MAGWPGVFAKLENGPLALIKTLCAQPMRGLGAIFRGLRRVSERSDVYGLALVALFLSFPVFHLYELLFKLAYASGSRELRRTGRRQRALGLQETVKEGDLDLFDLGVRRGGVQALQQVCHGLETAKARADFRDHHFSPR
jgi:hypothetical protein